MPNNTVASERPASDRRTGDPEMLAEMVSTVAPFDFTLPDLLTLSTA